MKPIIYFFNILFLAGSSLVFAETSVIVSSSSSIATLDKDEISDIFLGKSPTFPNGEEAVPIEYNEGNNFREVFHNGVTGKNQAQLKAYWSKLLFSGKGTPPKSVAEADDMKKLIAANPNMIGYIDSSAVDSSVKVVFQF